MRSEKKNNRKVVTIMSDNNEIATVDNGALTLAGDGSGAIVTSVDMSTMEGKTKVFSALQDTEKYDDHIGEVIRLRDVIFQNVTVESQETHQPDEAVRTTLIDEDGVPYTCTSREMVSSLHQMFSIFGEPQTWREAIPVTLCEGKSRKGNRFFYLNAVLDGKKKK